MIGPLWQPSNERIENANITTFADTVAKQYGISFGGYSDLYEWSIACPEQFWLAVWEFVEIIGAIKGEIVIDRDKMPGAQWFPSSTLNFAENLLRQRGSDVAIVFRGEDRVRKELSFDQLYDQVSRFAQALRAAGVVSGDRVVGYLPNMPETIIALLAASSIGAIWSSCSPDFGVQGILDRFGQIEPKILIAVDGYFYNGKVLDVGNKLKAVSEQLPSLSKVVVVPYVLENLSIGEIDKAEILDEFLAPFEAKQIVFEVLPFNHPLYILYSSGTTGVPKCMVHGAGGTLIQHLKELILHVDLKPQDRLFYFTTCGWMMWNWMVSALAARATLLLYDGSPFYPTGEVLFNFAELESMTVFGTSAKFIDAVNKAGLEPNRTCDLSKLKTMLSTGSPLVAESFDFVYDKIKSDICLSSIAGGTDIVSCFMQGSPTLPVWSGEAQCRGLGLKVEVFDDTGRSIVGQKGELVCTASFPSMPIKFWNDPDGNNYHTAYFKKFPGVWCHGDYVEITEHDGVIIYGRSDTVLNPGGVRIGTAEIYRQAEQVDGVVESLVIGQKWQGDTRVVLFVRLVDGLELEDGLISRIKQQIRSNTTPRHVPAKIIQIADIPRTRSGKIVELAVTKVVHREQVKNREALANPEALDLYSDLAELQV